jgi:hypothetical protein
VTGDLHCALMVTIAEQHKGLILAIEHRFYGESIPTPDFSTANLQFLSSRQVRAYTVYVLSRAPQALADIAVFSNFIKSKYALSDNKWLTFGGSYPGMLAAWVRIVPLCCVRHHVPLLCPALRLYFVSNMHVMNFYHFLNPLYVAILE